MNGSFFDAFLAAVFFGPGGLEVSFDSALTAETFVVDTLVPDFAAILAAGFLTAGFLATGFFAVALEVGFGVTLDFEAFVADSLAPGFAAFLAAGFLAPGFLVTGFFAVAFSPSVLFDTAAFAAGFVDLAAGFLVAAVFDAVFPLDLAVVLACAIACSQFY